MRTRHAWLVRPGAFMLCLVCSVGVAIVLIEALRQEGGGITTRYGVYVGGRARPVPFPRAIRDSSGATLLIPRKPQRIVSQTLGTDEILLAICNPQRIVALSVLVDDPQYSNVTELAHHITGRTNAGAEQNGTFIPI